MGALGRRVSSQVLRGGAERAGEGADGGGMRTASGPLQRHNRAAGNAGQLGKLGLAEGPVFTPCADPERRCVFLVLSHNTFGARFHQADAAPGQDRMKSLIEVISTS